MEDKKKKKKSKVNLAPEGVSLLVTADDKIEADVLESKLVAYGIPVAREYRETGAYLTILLGNTAFCIDLFVPTDRLNEAKNIIASAMEIKDEDILSDPSFSDKSLKEANDEFMKKTDKRIWWMAGFFIAAVAILIYLIFKG